MERDFHRHTNNGQEQLTSNILVNETKKNCNTKISLHRTWEGSADRVKVSIPWKEDEHKTQNEKCTLEKNI